MEIEGGETPSISGIAIIRQDMVIFCASTKISHIPAFSHACLFRANDCPGSEVGERNSIIRLRCRLSVGVF